MSHNKGRKMKKTINKRIKTIIIAVLILTLISITCMNNYRFIYYENWKVYLRRPDKIDTIYSNGYIDRTEFNILYYSDKKMEKILRDKELREMDIELIKGLIKKQIIFLTAEEETIFYEYVSDSLTKENYYKIIHKIDDISLQIIDISKNAVYILQVFK